MTGGERAAQITRDAIARALQLDDAEREYLFDLARTAPTTAAARATTTT